VQVGVLHLGPGSVASVPASLPRRARNAHRHGQLNSSRHVDCRRRCVYDWLMPLRQCEWVVYAKRPFSDPKRCSPTCRATRIGSRSLTRDSFACDDRGVSSVGRTTAKHGAYSLQTMTVATTSSCAASCCTCCLSGFHRIRHYGLLANAYRKTHIRHCSRASASAYAAVGADLKRRPFPQPAP